MSRFKVALFTGNYNHIRDGVSLTLNRLVRFLMDQGIEVLVFGPSIKEPALDHYGKLIEVPSMRMPGRPEYRITFAFPEFEKQKLDDFNPDIIHIATPDLLGFKALKWANNRDIPVVSSYHTHFPSYLKYYKLSILEPLMWRYLSWFYHHCEQLYVPTPSMADFLKMKKVQCDLKIWSRGIDTAKFNPKKRDENWRKDFGIKPDDLVITFVSRLVWEKNLKIYAEVLKKLTNKYSYVKALVVGDGPAGEELKELLPNAIYTGFLKGDDLSKAYASSDLFFFPSDTETFGNVTLEAMASGLPCIVADAVGSKSLVEQNVNGFLAPVSQTDLFYTYIDQLITDEDLRKKMAASSLEKAKNYSWEIINGNLLNYYEQVLEL